MRGSGDRRNPAAGLYAAATLLVAGLLVLPAHSVRAQGFSLNEQSSCAMGRANTGVAAPCDDGSAVVFNPAALAGIDGWRASLGGALVATGGDFTSDFTGAVTELETDPVPAPHGYLAWGPTDRLGVAIGAFAPYGLATAWPRSFDGRFSGYDNSLRTIYVQPTAAYRLSEAVSVGAGLDLAVGSVELNQRLDLSRQPVPESNLPPGTTFAALGVPFHTDFADLRLESDGATGVGGHVGVQVEATDRVRLGARYLSQVTLDYDGEALFDPVPTGITLPAGNPLGLPAGTPLDAVLEAAGLFAPGGVLGDQGVETTITMPDQLVAGVAVDATDRLLLLADLQWMDWSDFDRVRLDFENPATPDEVRVEDFEDTRTLRLGAEYDGGDGISVRGGYAFNEAAAPDDVVTPLLPEANRNQLSVGAGWRGPNGIEVNAAYLHIAQDERRGRTIEPRVGEEPSTALNNGLYSFTGDLFAATVTYHF